MNPAVPTGTRLGGRYEVKRRIGAGGMGEVYLAQDTGKLGREVAVKFLPAEVAADPHRLQRFELEASTVASLTHQNIVAVYDFGEEGGARFVVTEYVDGVTLRQHLAGRRLKLHDVLDVAIQVAAALDAAHRAGIVHRDIKPENVMVRRDHTVKVLDFGLAKPFEASAGRGVDTEAGTRIIANTSAGMILGTVAYMSPEQSRGEHVDARSDIWSLGCVLYEMLAGHLPFAASDVHRQIIAIQEQEAAPLTHHVEGVPERLEEIVLKSLSKDPDDRYQTAKDLLIDLKNLKRKLELDAEINRTAAPELRALASEAGGARTPSHTSPHAAAQTAAGKAAHKTEPANRTSVEYVVTGLKRHKAAAAVAGLLLAAAVAGLVFLLPNRRAQALTERDTILLADFVNTTGDPVFDGTLRQALAVQLGQSPFLNIYPEERVREALRFMGRAGEERVTRDVAREICERQNLKALLVGSISNLGSQYVITVEAVNARTGEAIAREQAEADSKEQVLGRLGEAAKRLREKLGESLGSIRKFDARIEQATTSSLEALKAFSLGNERRDGGDPIGAVPFYKRAVELDPNFALAHAVLSVVYANAGEAEFAREYAAKAFELRERVSERERFYISEKYYSYVTGEREKAREVLETWRQTYPRDIVPRVNMGVYYSLIGRYDKALEEAQAALGIDPNSDPARANVIDAYISLGRFDEATEATERLFGRAPDSPGYHLFKTKLALVRADTDALAHESEWYAGKPYEFDFLSLQGASAAASGRVRRSLELARGAGQGYRARGMNDNAALLETSAAEAEGYFADCKRAAESAARGLAISRGRPSLVTSGLAFSLCGDTARARAVAEELAKRYPKDSITGGIWLPLIRAASDIKRGDGAAAVESLRPAERYEMGDIATYRVTYLRGQAHLLRRAGADAAAEFQKILDRPGVDPFSPLRALARLGLARASALSGDNTRARIAYQDFLALWKDADQDLPVLQEARREYEALKQ
jgi:eukaryotic-like serine/threonine-protein kinase